VLSFEGPKSRKDLCLPQLDSIYCTANEKIIILPTVGNRHPHPISGRSSACTHNADELEHRGIVYIKVPRSGDAKEFEESLARRLFLYHMFHDKFFSYYLSSFIGAILLDFPDYMEIGNHLIWQLSSKSFVFCLISTNDGMMGKD
jgi:hypothetical protein